MLKEKKVGELGFLAECENCSEELGTNVLATTADNLHHFPATLINFADYKTFDDIIDVLNRMESVGLHLVGSDGKTVFKSSKMCEVLKTFKEMKEENADTILVYSMLPLLTRTCNLRLQAFRIFFDNFSIGKEYDDDVEDNNKNKGSKILDLPMG